MVDPPLKRVPEVVVAVSVRSPASRQQHTDIQHHTGIGPSCDGSPPQSARPWAALCSRAVRGGISPARAPCASRRARRRTPPAEARRGGASTRHPPSLRATACALWRACRARALGPRSATNALRRGTWPVGRTSTRPAVPASWQAGLTDARGDRYRTTLVCGLRPPRPPQRRLAPAERAPLGPRSVANAVRRGPRPSAAQCVQHRASQHGAASGVARHRGRAALRAPWQPTRTKPVVRPRLPPRREADSILKTRAS